MEKDNIMTNKWKMTLALASAGALVIGALVSPAGSAAEASEESIEEEKVVLEEVVEETMSSAVTNALAEPAGLQAVSGTAVSGQAAGGEEAASAQDTGDIDDEKDEVDGHVELNLNYSRLGIASNLDTYLNVRKKPSTNAKIVGKMTKNSGCHIYYIKKGWAKIISGGVKGFVKASYLSTDKEAEELATQVGRNVVEIQTDSLRVRALPTLDAPIYSVVSEGEEFRIKKDNLTLDFVKKIIEKEKISNKALKRAGGYEAIEQSMSNFICIYVDNEYAFVAKEYVKEQYSLKRAVKVKTVKASASSGVSSSQASIVEYAKQFLGNRYVWGGSSLTGGTDCSGFTMSLYAHYGHSLPHNAAAQAGVTRSVSSPKPGDLFFYSNGSRINHVAMYIGGGMVIHASNPSDGIKISNAYYRRPVKIGRVMN